MISNSVMTCSNPHVNYEISRQGKTIPLVKRGEPVSLTVTLVEYTYPNRTVAQCQVITNSLRVCYF